MATDLFSLPSTSSSASHPPSCCAPAPRACSLGSLGMLSTSCLISISPRFVLTEFKQAALELTPGGQPVIMSHLSPTPNATLLDGLQQSDTHAQHMAYLELVHIVASDPKRRKAIFDDADQQPPALPLIMRACLAQLHVDQQRVIHPHAAPPTPPPALQQHTSSQSAMPSVTLKTGGVVQQSRSTFLDRLAKTQSDPTPPSQPVTGAPLPQQQQQQQQQQQDGSVPSILRNAPQQQQQSQQDSSAATPAPASNSDRPTASPSQMCSFIIRKACGDKSQITQWLLDPLPEPAILHALPQPELDIWIVHGVS